MKKDCDLMDSVIVKPSILKGTIKPPNSKSYTHRALCLSVLSSSPTLIVDPLLSRDTQATLTSCIKLPRYNFFTSNIDGKKNHPKKRPAI